MGQMGMGMGMGMGQGGPMGAARMGMQQMPQGGGSPVILVSNLDEEVCHSSILLITKLSQHKKQMF